MRPGDPLGDHGQRAIALAVIFEPVLADEDGVGLGALLLGYYDLDGRLIYAGRAGTGIKQAERERAWRKLQPLAVSEMPLDLPPPRDSRFGSPLVLSRVQLCPLVGEGHFRNFEVEVFGKPARAAFREGSTFVPLRTESSSDSLRWRKTDSNFRYASGE